MEVMLWLEVTSVPMIWRGSIAKGASNNSDSGGNTMARSASNTTVTGRVALPEVPANPRFLEEHYGYKCQLYQCYWRLVSADMSAILKFLAVMV